MLRYIIWGFPPLKELSIGEHLDILTEFVRYAWFKRKWIIQDVVVARRAYIILKASSINFDDFTRIIGDCYSAKNRYDPAVMDPLERATFITYVDQNVKHKSQPIPRFACKTCLSSASWRQSSKIEQLISLLLVWLLFNCWRCLAASRRHDHKTLFMLFWELRQGQTYQHLSINHHTQFH